MPRAFEREHAKAAHDLESGIALTIPTARPVEATPSAGPGLERATLRKVSRRLLPFLFVLYLGCFLDRVNVGFAALQMNRDLGLSATVYGFGAGVFFLGYCLFEVPSNLVLVRVGARRWIARIMISWGLLSSAMMFVTGPRSFYMLRFLLGMAEAGFFPGMIYYLSTWFPARSRARAVSWFMTAIPIAGVIGGPVSGALLTLNGRLGLAGWQWLFLVEGLPSVLLGVSVFRYLTDRPEQARWLSNDERSWLVGELRAERVRQADRHHLTLRRALGHRTVWELGLLYSMGSAGIYGLALWLPQIVKAISGSSDLVVGFLSAIPYLAAALGMVLVGAHSDRTGERFLHLEACGVIAAGGFLASAYLESPGLALAALSIAAFGLNARNGPFWALPPLFLAEEAAAGGIALINTVGATAGFLAPYGIGLIKDATGSYRDGLLLLSMVVLASTLVVFRLRRAPVLAPAAGPPITGDAG